MGAEVTEPCVGAFMDRQSDLTIAQATGAMFQTYVFHINGLGAGGNGQSVIIDPTGRILDEPKVLNNSCRSKLISVPCGVSASAASLALASH